MKIGILTYHRSINDGAVMQCYSLSKRLQSEFPEAKVEVIDYHMPKIQRYYDVSMKKYLFSGSLRSRARRAVKLMLQPDLVRRMRNRKCAFENCLGQLPLSDKKIIDDGTDELFEYINKYYDIVIAGSDAIWNYNLRGYPNPYFLSDKIRIPMLSYAASCYGMVYEKIPDAQKKEIAGILSRYSFLGVRDDETARFVQSIGASISPVHTCDPTVFLDVNDLPVNSAVLEEKMRARGFDFTKPAIGVMSGNQMCRMVRRMYGKRYQIIGLQSPSVYADVNLDDLSPYEWSYVFRYFSLTFTTFFHGTLLSLRNGVPVIAIALESEYSRNHMTKVQDFLLRVGMEDCYFKTDYSRRYDADIKTKADQLISTNDRERILRQMDSEAVNVEKFINCIRCLIVE